MTAGLPDGFVVALRGDVRRRGSLLVGGSPKRVVRLSERAHDLLRDGRLRVGDGDTRRLADRLLELDLAVPVLDALPQPSTRQLTVVVPVRDRHIQLGRLLAALGGDVRRVIVDDASVDARSTAATASRYGAEVVRLESNVGPAAARNEGLALVRTPYVAFVDSDVVVTGEELSRLLRHFSDPAVAAVAPRVRATTAAARPHWFQRYEAAVSSLDLGRRPAVVRPLSMVSWLPSACLLARVDALGAGFDGSLRVAEDVDLVWRLAAAGHRVRYEPSVEVLHDTRATLAEWLGRKVYYGTGGELLARRHRELVAPAVFSPLPLLACLALLGQRRWSLPVAASCVLPVAVRLVRSLPAEPGRAGLAAALTAQGLVDTAAQVSALLLRHWWPLGLAGSVLSRRVRRAVVLAAAADAVWLRRELGADLVPFLLARRLDDAAYGLGLWAGSVRGRSLRALRPVVRTR